MPSGELEGGGLFESPSQQHALRGAPGYYK